MQPSKRFTITVRPEELSKVLGWFARGITVRQSHYMPECPVSFQPMDNDQPSHWKSSASDVTRVPTAECADTFSIAVLETEYDVSVPCACGYCVNGKRTRENNPALLSWDANVHRCPRCDLAMGFSFDEPHHATIGRFGNLSSEPATTLQDVERIMCPETLPPAYCWVCNGTGIGRRYLSQMPKGERNKAIRAMHDAGWKVTYIRLGEATWLREREPLVKQFGQTVETVSHESLSPVRKAKESK